VRTKRELPGFFRPTKDWDMLVVHEGHLIAAVEFKSQRGPSFGNNFNNRTEEAIGNATDLWTAFREGAYGKGRPRSTTFGMPRPRSPPPLFGIHTRRMSPGRYVPSSSDRDNAGINVPNASPTSCTLCRSGPGAPLLPLRRFFRSVRCCTIDFHQTPPCGPTTLRWSGSRCSGPAPLSRRWEVPSVRVLQRTLTYFMASPLCSAPMPGALGATCGRPAFDPTLAKPFVQG
jgi:hypothetical protein